MIEQTRLRRSQSGHTKRPTQAVGTIKVSALCAVAKDRYPENFRALSCVGTHSARHEYQSTTTIGPGQGRSPFHGLGVEIPAPVVDPAEVMVAVKVTELAGSSSGGDSV